MSNVYSQKTIEGTVLELGTNKPLSDTHVYIENTSLGTITNEDGSFKLIIPKEYKNGIVVFSLLGFETKKMVETEVLNNGEAFIMLSPVSEILDEVVISTVNVKLDGLSIVKKAFENYTKNFPHKPYLSKGFIRHSERTDEEYKWMTEVAFVKYDAIKGKDIDINVLESRKSLDNRVLDTLSRLRAYLKDITNNGFRKRNKKAENYEENFDNKFIKKAFAYYDNHYTAGFDKNTDLLEKILSRDAIRNYNQKDAIFTDENISKIKFIRDTILGFGKETVYKVKFSVTYTDYPQLGIGWLFVRANDYAILEMDYSLVLGKTHHYRKATGIEIQYNYNIKYQDFNGRMYPLYLSFKSFKINAFNKLNRKLIVDGTYNLDEILFSEIISDDEVVAKSTVNKDDWDGNMFSERKYNPSFWENYNFLLQSKEEQKLISDLEKKISLKMQFEKE